MTRVAPAFPMMADDVFFMSLSACPGLKEPGREDRAH